MHSCFGIRISGCILNVQWKFLTGFSLHILHPNLVVPAPQVSTVAARCASKKTKSNPKNKGGQRVGKRYGWKKHDGDYVHAGNILATQRLIRWHPGAQVYSGWGSFYWLWSR
uniref:Mitochondrial ribosomal protein L27 n=1 Tax=Crocodylus porosus TaxID=8502 RepID=A0A7M4E2X6_CROPO